MHGRSSTAEPSAGRPSSWRWVTRLLIAAAVLLVLFVLWSVWDHQAIMAAIPRAGPLPLFAAMAVLPAVGLPLTPFFVLAGASFGIAVGLVGSAVALGLNLALCYWIARSGMRPRLESMLRRSRYELPDFAEMSKGAVRFALAVKVTPGLPGFAKNYVLGVAGVPFALYFGVSMLITGAYAVALVVLGESFLHHNLSRTLLAGAAVAVLAFGLWLWRKKRGRGGRRLDQPPPHAG
jgi:uncharacterized membrane protein YdjX (TVP38/TMEM64 family)